MAYLDDAIGARAIALSDVEMKRREEPYRPHPTLGFKTSN
jgi:hypothetical protein